MELTTLGKAPVPFVVLAPNEVLTQELAREMLAQVAPKTSCYVLSCKGLFMAKQTGLYCIVKELKGISAFGEAGPLGFLTGDKIPVEILAQICVFFETAARLYHTEAMAVIDYHQESRLYLPRIPMQFVAASEIYRYLPGENPPGCVRLVTLHSHPFGEGADFHSGQDHDDQTKGDKTGLHVVVAFTPGRELLRPRLNIVLAADKERYPLTPSDLFDFTGLEGNRLPKSFGQLCASTQIPDAWLDQVYPASQYPGDKAAQAGLQLGKPDRARLTSVPGKQFELFELRPEQHEFQFAGSALEELLDVVPPEAGSSTKQASYTSEEIYARELKSAQVTLEDGRPAVRLERLLFDHDQTCGVLLLELRTREHTSCRGAESWARTRTARRLSEGKREPTSDHLAAAQQALPEYAAFWEMLSDQHPRTLAARLPEEQAIAIEVDDLETTCHQLYLALPKAPKVPVAIVANDGESTLGDYWRVLLVGRVTAPVTAEIPTVLVPVPETVLPVPAEGPVPDCLAHPKLYDMTKLRLEARLGRISIQEGLLLLARTQLQRWILQQPARRAVVESTGLLPDRSGLLIEYRSEARVYQTEFPKSVFGRFLVFLQEASQSGGPVANTNAPTPREVTTT